MLQAFRMQRASVVALPFTLSVLLCACSTGLRWSADPGPASVEPIVHLSKAAPDALSTGVVATSALASGQASSTTAPPARDTRSPFIIRGSGNLVANLSNRD